MKVQTYIDRRIIKRVKEIIEAHYDKYDDRASVVDILTDLKHFCQKKDIDFWDCDETATNHHREETRDANEGVEL